MAPKPPTVVFVDVFGAEHPVTPGVVDDAARVAFISGHCRALALAVHERTGWPLRVLVEESNSWLSLSDDVTVLAAANRGEQIPDPYLSNLWAHALVERPDGLLVDIHGARTADTVVHDYTGFADGAASACTGRGRHRLIAVSREAMHHLPTCAPPSPVAAVRPFVDAVLALPDRPARPWPWQGAVEAALAELVSDIAAGCIDWDAPGSTQLDDLAEEDLLAEAIRRALVPPDLLPQARTVLRDWYTHAGEPLLTV